MNLENLDESLAEIRHAAKEYYARKSGTWKPKRDLDAERLEDAARFRREAFMSVPWMIEPERMVTVRPDLEKIERIRSAFEHFDMSSLESRMKEIVYKMTRETPRGTIIIDEIPTISPIDPLVKEYKHRFLCGEWEELTAKIGEGRNPMADHTIRAVKKSHAKRKFSKKSRHGIL